VKLTIYLQLVQRYRKYESVHPVLHIASSHCTQLVKHRGNFMFNDGYRHFKEQTASIFKVEIWFNIEVVCSSETLKFTYKTT
jgi:hypothetical protein